MTNSTYVQQIDELLHEQDEVYQIQQDEKWKIRDLSTAVWVDGIIHEREVSIATKEKIADDNIAVLQAKIEKLKQWRVDTTKKEIDDIEFFKSHLHVWHMNTINQEKADNEELKAKGKKEKKLSLTIKLPYRDLTCRKQQPEVVKDDVVLTKWVEDNHSSIIPYVVLTEFLEAKNESDNCGISVFELLDIIKPYESEYIKREAKLVWGEFKKTLTMTEIDGKRVYMDENGSIVDCVELKDTPEKYEWKHKKEE